MEGIINQPIEYMLNKQIMIVPLLSGSGIRVKIIEGMALGKVIISTSIGANGINCEHNKNIIIADTPAEFQKAIKKCMEDSSFCKEISEAAIIFAHQTFESSIVTNQFVEFYQSL